MPSKFEQTIPEFSCLFDVPNIGHFVPVNELRILGYEMMMVFNLKSLRLTQNESSLKDLALSF